LEAVAAKVRVPLTLIDRGTDVTNAANPVTSEAIVVPAKVGIRSAADRV
jgi:hypothetical protein